MNEGGLFAEREGWHLPGFDTASAGFTARDLSAGLPSGGAGVGFFVTTFDLDLPAGTDPQFSFVFDGGVGKSGQAYRALLFVNGWKFGKVRIYFHLCCEEVLIVCVHSAWRTSARRRRSLFPSASWTPMARSECYHHVMSQRYLTSDLQHCRRRALGAERHRGHPHSGPRGRRHHRRRCRPRRDQQPGVDVAFLIRAG